MEQSKCNLENPAAAKAAIIASAFAIAASAGKVLHGLGPRWSPP